MSAMFRIFRVSAASVLVFALFLAGVLSAQSATAGDNLPKVVIVATGGTIASKVDPATGDVVPALSGDELLEAVPQLGDVARLESVEFSDIDSSKITPELWLGLAKTVQEQVARPDVQGVVVTHGTDTMAETAWFLDLTVDTDKPVVLVGAQHNASDPFPDGPENILHAVRQAAAPNTAGLGVTLTMNQYINAARNVRKTHTDNPMTFKSGEKGYLGYVYDNEVVVFRKPARRLHFPIPESLPRVVLFTMYAGAEGDMIRHAVDNGAKGVVVAALGIGNVNGPVFEALKYAMEQGAAVVIGSRCENGRTYPVYGGPGGGRELQRLGAIFTNDLQPVKARILLMLALAQGLEGEALAEVFGR